MDSVGDGGLAAPELKSSRNRPARVGECYVTGVRASRVQQVPSRI